MHLRNAARALKVRLDFDKAGMLWIVLDISISMLRK
jgi:hypothetical protein